MSFKSAHSRLMFCDNQKLLLVFVNKSLFFFIFNYSKITTKSLTDEKKNTIKQKQIRLAISWDTQVLQ